MSPDWLYRDIPVLGQRVHRVGLVGNFGIEPKTFEAALDAGLNYVFWTPKMTKVTPVLKAALKKNRTSIVLATGPTFSFFGGSLRSGTEKILRLLDIEYIDILQQFWLGKWSAQTGATTEALAELKESGKVRLIGTSIHDRERAGQLAADRAYDMLMVRYNAAHPGAEVDIFPHVDPMQTMVVSYTATRWRKLLKRPRGWDGPIATAADCYRFSLSRAEVDLSLMGVKTHAQLEENLKGLEKGPMTGEEMSWMREFGRAVHG
jgi:aryl-alcohol dehydrogenase-like predicted oxidoreductase